MSSFIILIIFVLAIVAYYYVMKKEDGTEIDTGPEDDFPRPDFKPFLQSRVSGLEEEDEEDDGPPSYEGFIEY